MRNFVLGLCLCFLLFGGEVLGVDPSALANQSFGVLKNDVSGPASAVQGMIPSIDLSDSMAKFSGMSGGLSSATTIPNVSNPTVTKPATTVITTTPTTSVTKPTTTSVTKPAITVLPTTSVVTPARADTTSTAEKPVAGGDPFEDMTKPCEAGDNSKDNYCVELQEKILNFKSIRGANGYELVGNFIGVIYKYAASVLGIICVLVIVISGGQIMFGGVSADNETDAKERIFQALGSLVLLFLTALILKTVNPGFFIVS